MQNIFHVYSLLFLRNCNHRPVQFGFLFKCHFHLGCVWWTNHLVAAYIDMVYVLLITELENSFLAYKAFSKKPLIIYLEYGMQN